MGHKINLEKITIKELFNLGNSHWTTLKEACIDGAPNDKIVVSYKVCGGNPAYKIPKTCQVIVERKNHLPWNNMVHFIVDDSGQVWHSDYGITQRDKTGRVVKKEREQVFNADYQSKPALLDEIKEKLYGLLRKDYRPIKHALQFIAYSGGAA
ncbi:MAG: hypothetical protein KKE23_02290 [Nanoarchaeota archaeon]|nr:hypothetical protein [Nanoarchaeota archaeon]